MSIAELIDSYKGKAKAIKEMNQDITSIRFNSEVQPVEHVISYPLRKDEHRDFIKDHGLNKWLISVVTDDMILALWSEKVK